MILSEICNWVTAEGRRGGSRFDSCAASLLYMEAFKARDFLLSASQTQRYEFYRNAFEPMRKFVEH